MLGTGVIRDGMDEHPLGAEIGMWTEGIPWINAVSKTIFENFIC